MKVVVIGSGIGGCTAASLLAKKGNKVVLLERNSFVGGRCSSLRRNGFIVDNGIHLFSLGENGPLGRVASLVGADIEFIRKDPAVKIVWGKRSFYLPANLLPLLNRMKVAFHLRVRLRELLSVWRAFRDIINFREEDMERFDEKTVAEWIQEYTHDEKFHSFVNFLCLLLFVLPYNEASAGEFLFCTKRMFRVASVSYVRGGAGNIPSSLISAFMRYGGKLRLNTEARKIVIDSGIAKYVETDSESLPADFVISNAGINQTMRLAGYKEKELRNSHSIFTIKYGLKKKVIEEPCILNIPQDMEGIEATFSGKTLPPEPYIFLTVPSNWDPEIAPGKQLIILGVLVTHPKLADSSLDQADEWLNERYDVERNLLWKERTTPKEMEKFGRPDCIGLAQIPSQVGKNKPSQRILKNLYLVGCDAGARGVGTEQAAESGLKVAETFPTLPSSK